MNDELRNIISGIGEITARNLIQTAFFYLRESKTISGKIEESEDKNVKDIMSDAFELAFKIWLRSFLITSASIILIMLSGFAGGSDSGGAALGLMFMCVVFNALLCFVNFLFSMFQIYRIEKLVFLEDKVSMKVGIYCVTAFICPLLMFYIWQSREELSFFPNLKYLLLDNSIWSGLIWIYFLTVSYSIIYYKIFESDIK